MFIVVVIILAKEDYTTKLFIILFSMVFFRGRRRVKEKSHIRQERRIWRKNKIERKKERQRCMRVIKKYVPIKGDMMMTVMRWWWWCSREKVLRWTVWEYKCNVWRCAVNMLYRLCVEKKVSKSHSTVEFVGIRVFKQLNVYFELQKSMELMQGHHGWFSSNNLTEFKKKIVFEACTYIYIDIHNMFNLIDISLLNVFYFAHRTFPHFFGIWWFLYKYDILHFANDFTIFGLRKILHFLLDHFFLSL